MAVVVYVPSRLGEGFFTDLAAPTAGDDAKAITYDHDTGAFVYAAAGGGTPGGSTTQVQYNNAGAFGGDAGMTYDAANDRLTVAGGLGVGTTPAALVHIASSTASAARLRITETGDTTDSHYAGLELYDGGSFSAALLKDGSSQNISVWAGGTKYLTLTTLGSLGLGIVPAYKLHVYTPAGSAIDQSVYFQNLATSKRSMIVADCSSNALGADGARIDFRAHGTGYSETLFGNAMAGMSALLSLSTNGLMIGEYFAKPIIFGTNNAEAMRIDSSLRVMVGQTSATALLDLAASTPDRSSLRIRSGVAPSTTPPNDGDVWNDGNAYAYMVNGTNAVNTDGGLSIWMQNSTTARNVGRLLWQYTDKTDATRVTEGALTAYYQSTEHKAIRWRGGSGGPLLSFYDVTTPIARQVLATGASATPDDIIQVLQNLGLVKQS